jgi:phosphohistidine phosphatase
LKKLYLVRHAKSSWDNTAQRDFDRPLNNRGKRDAPFMGNMISKKGVKPDLIISSPAIRAFTTAKYFADELNYPVKEIIREENLYEASVSDILSIISGIDDKNESLMVFSHNPGLTDFSNFISDKQIDNIPTAAVVSLILKTEHWNGIDKKTCTLEFFEYPKKYFK